MFDFILTMLLAPLLILQGLLVRKSALILPEADGPRTGVGGSGPDLKILIIGDSSAAGVGVAHQSDALSGQLAKHLEPSSTLTWQLIAQTGATTRSTLSKLETLPDTSFDVVVVALGVNDITRFIPRCIWLNQQSRLIQTLRAKFKPSHIFLSAIPPIGDFPALPNPLSWMLGRHAANFDAGLAKQTQPDPNVTYMHLDLPFDPTLMAADGYHPGPEVYGLWGKQLAVQIVNHSVQSP